MRLALLTEFPAKLDPHFLQQLAELHALLLLAMRNELNRTAQRLRNPAADIPEPEPLGQLRLETIERYCRLVRDYLQRHDEEFPAEVARMNLYALSADALGGKLEQLQQADWALLARHKRSLWQHRVLLFVHSLVAPFVDLWNFTAEIALGE